MLQAILYRYFGENTVQTNKCVRCTVQVAIIKNRPVATKRVISPWCRNRMLRSPAACLRRRRSIEAEVHHIGPDQLLAKVRIPTATTLKPLMPLYALDRSMEDMEFDPPNAKKEKY
jgi:hypothetical protein